MILLLEDNLDRIERLRTAAARLEPALAMHIWRDARTMIRDVGVDLPSARLICLDHDLDPAEPGHDPGDGLEVAKFLVSQPIIRPVLIHSSNSDRARQMQGEFELAGWPCARVLPFGDNWIETDWLPQAAALLGIPR
jgi:Cyclic-phosphate processing Receiver domain